MKALMLLAILLVCVGCAVGERPVLRAPDRTDVNQAKDELECMAMASQAAMGTGDFTTAAPFRAAMYDYVKQHYFVKCMQSRGYTLVTAR